MESLSPTSSVAEVAAATGALLSNSPDEAARADKIIREQCCDGQVLFLVKEEPEDFIAQLQLSSFGSKIKVKAALKMLGSTVGPSHSSEAPNASPKSTRQPSAEAETNQGDGPPKPASQKEDFTKCTAQEQQSPVVLPTPSPVLASGEGEDLSKLSPVPLTMASPRTPAAGADVERNSNAVPAQDIQTGLGAHASASVTAGAATVEQKLSDVKPEPMEIDVPIGPVVPPATTDSERAGSAEPPAQTAVAGAQVKAEPGADAPEIKPESVEAPKSKAQASTPRQMFKQTIDGAKQALETMKMLLMQKGKSLAPTNRVKAWTDAAGDLLRQTAVPSTRIGVIGDTGAGKSSLINAALGEESILPTNGMRACTATVIRLEYNTANRLYEGEVHFVARDELRAEVELLLADAKEDGTSIKVGSRLKNDSAKELAIAKLVSIWGKDVIQRPNLTADYLLGLPGVTSVLGAVKHIRNAKAKDFSKEMNKYVDSTPSNEMTGGAFWPLVKEACIRHAWPLLESGAIIVDLPGVRDANAARAKVAEGYLKKCNTIWVAANICRAVDDGTAKNLLGDNFRRQLLMDGQYGKLAFICTKVDDINTGETINTLGVRRICEDNGVSEEEFDKLTRDIDELEDKKYTAEKLNKTHQERLDRYKEQIERWTEVRDNLSEELELDHGVPDETERSLPHDLVAALEAAEAAEAAGEANTGEADEGDQSEVEEDGASEDEDEDWMPATKRARVDPELPTHDQAFLPGEAGKLQAKRRKLNLKLRKLHLNFQLSTKVVRETDAEINVVLGPLTRLTKRLKYLCVIARNKYSTHELKEDFKAGLEEMQELAGNSGALQAQDLDLPVFCISSKEAQTFSRTARRSGSAQVFSNVEDTGLPRLRSYLHDITGKQQVAGAKRMATALTGYFAGICTYLSDDGTLDSEVREQIRELCERHTGRLDAEVKEKLAVSSGKLQAMFTTDEIQPQLHAGVEDAVNRAVSTARKWGNSARADNPGDRGLHWATYKAAVRPGRFGIYTSRTAGQIDMNEALAKPIHNKVSVAWDTVMNSRAKEHLLEYQTEVLGSLGDFCKELRKVLLGLGVEEPRILRVERTAEVDYTEKLETKIEEVLKFMEEQQRDISRALNPEIQERMKDAYIGCTEERGSGSFNRMKAIMEKHVDSERQTMFEDASERMLAALEDLAVQIRDMTGKITEGLTKTLQQHYGCFWDDPVLDLAGRNAAAADLSIICKQADAVCAVAGVAPQPWSIVPRTAPEPKPRAVPKPKAEPGSTATSKYAAWSLTRPEDFDSDDEESDDDEESEENDPTTRRPPSPELDDDDEEDDDEEEEENNHSPTCHVDFCVECNECHHCEGYDCDGNDYEDDELNEDEDEEDEDEDQSIY